MLNLACQLILANRYMFILIFYTILKHISSYFHSERGDFSIKKSSWFKIDNDTGQVIQNQCLSKCKLSLYKGYVIYFLILMQHKLNVIFFY